MSEVSRRLKARLEDPTFRNRYKKLLEDPTMRELAEVMRDTFCRPVAGKDWNGEAALFAQGYTQGAWDFYEGLFSFLDIQEDQPVVEETYGVKVGKQNEGKAGEEK